MTRRSRASIDGVNHVCGGCRLNSGPQEQNDGGGTRHSANSRAPVPTVTATPNAMPATTTSTIAANQPWINLDRVISFSMVFHPCLESKEVAAPIQDVAAGKPRHRRPRVEHTHHENRC